MYRPHVLVLTVLFEGGLGLMACLVGWLLGRPPWQSIQWTGQAIAVGAVAAVPPLILARWMTRSRRRPLVRLTGIVRELVAELFDAASWWTLLAVAVLAGFGEELLFRGLIEDLIGLACGPAVGLVVASALFGLAHSITRTYALVAASIGFYLGGLWLYCDNLLVPIVTHAGYDFVALVYLVHWHHRQQTLPASRRHG